MYILENEYRAQTTTVMLIDRIEANVRTFRAKENLFSIKTAIKISDKVLRVCRGKLQT
jgi:hypothetical protein